jgi:iron complex transport system substrate-binding protein
MRILSLLPCATEIVYRLGLEAHLVGISHECDYPPELSRLALPRVTENKYPLDGSSAEIDAQIQRLVSEGLAVYRVHGDLLQRLLPDVILTQMQCQVCAVNEQDVRAALCEVLCSADVKVVAMNPENLPDIFRDIQLIADACGVSGRGVALNAELQERMQRIARASEPLLPRRTVACIEWIEPLMTGGNWVPALVHMAGGANLFGEAGKHSPYLEWQAVLDRDPDVLVVFPCGWDMARSRRDMHFLTRRPGWGSLRAVLSGNVYMADGNQYFNRPGPRVVESLEILAEILHPELFRFGHGNGRGWERF